MKDCWKGHYPSHSTFVPFTILSSKGAVISTCGAVSVAAPPDSAANGFHQTEATKGQQEVCICQFQS